MCNGWNSPRRSAACGLCMSVRSFTLGHNTHDDGRQKYNSVKKTASTMSSIWHVDLTSHYSPAFAVLWQMLFSTPCDAPPSGHALLVLDCKAFFSFQFSSLCVFTSTLSQRSRAEMPESFPGSPSCPKLQGPEWRFLWPPGTHPSSGTPSGKHCLASKTAQQHRVNCPHNGGEGHFI